MIVLDTHAWLWWIRRDAIELPAAMFALIDNSPSPVALASVSCLEVALLIRKGRVTVPLHINEFFIKLILLPLTPSIAARAAYLPDIHRDPIDRVIIATA